MSIVPACLTDKGKLFYNTSLVLRSRTRSHPLFSLFLMSFALIEFRCYYGIDHSSTTVKLLLNQKDIYELEPLLPLKVIRRILNLMRTHTGNQSDMAKLRRPVNKPTIMDKSLGTLLHFFGVFQFTQDQPLLSPHKQCWTSVSRIFFRVPTLYVSV